MVPVRKLSAWGLCCRNVRLSGIPGGSIPREVLSAILCGAAWPGRSSGGCCPFRQTMAEWCQSVLMESDDNGRLMDIRVDGMRLFRRDGCLEDSGCDDQNTCCGVQRV